MASATQQWLPNGLRHSFGSYHLSFYGDAMKTATLMGHKDPSILHNHYKALVLKTEAEKYWNLRPELVKAVDEGE
jgi:integrase